VEFEQTPRAAPLHRPLVAADPDIDPHRLVAVCCQHAGDEPVSVSLLIPVDDDGRPWSESAARAERLLRDVDVLLGAAGIDLDEVVITGEAGPELRELVRFGGFDALFVCARHDTESHGVLRLAARLAREQGLEVIASGRTLDHPGWLRRAIGPLFHWAHPQERAA
jgi:nucleotide-binding universal stress UspA family protein